MKGSYVSRLNMKELLYGKTRTYLVGGVLLVDTDWAGTLPSLFRKLKESNIPTESIRYLMITHYHPDHMGIASELMDLGVKLVIFDVQLPHVHFSDCIYAKEKNRAYKPIDESLAVVLTCAESREFLSKLGISGEVIHTPGHSEDSVSLILDDGTAIVGDLPPYSALAAIDDEKVQNSYKNILSRGVSRLHYGHMVSERIDRK